MSKRFPRNGKMTAAPVRIILPPAKDALPPHSLEDERGVLGCVLMAGEQIDQLECDELLGQLRPRLFYDLRHRTLFEQMAQMRMGDAKHAITTACVLQFLKAEKKMDEAGGQLYVATIVDQTPSVANFASFLGVLKDKFNRRWASTKSEEIRTLVNTPDFSLTEVRERLAEIYDTTATSGQAMIEVITPKEARAFVPDVSDYLIGNGLVSQEMFITIGGEPGCGKSRLATTLAVALARGNGTWQGYPVRAKAHTLILQTENKGSRLKEEFDAVPDKFDDCIKVSKNLPHGLAFAHADFRRELLRLHEKWPFQLLVVDPWNDVCSDEGQADYKESLLNIQQCFRGRKMPAVAIVAHLRKARNDSSGRRKAGRELLHELSGSLALGSTSRTVFAVQPASYSMDDDRIVFEVAKANDADPAWLAEFGTRSAWHRKNGAFESCADFDWEEWQNPSGGRGEERRALDAGKIREAFGGEKFLSKSGLAKRCEEKFEVGYSTVMKAISKGPGGYLANLFTVSKEGWLELK